ncbi:hypothetical protein EX30DRAFT_338185 [Ascodesmis nigricans]|uniref:Uncharacterized protein n=1 Tax=Ascodesmis nigricans TaxID=341454 RepID=A0A4S2N2Z3_9PEZI|nr:hypothetical protein EX30DRAFT_338185 [Ascodesmis nigricans]
MNTLSPEIYIHTQIPTSDTHLCSSSSRPSIRFIQFSLGCPPRRSFITHPTHSLTHSAIVNLRRRSQPPTPTAPLPTPSTTRSLLPSRSRSLFTYPHSLHLLSALFRPKLNTVTIRSLAAPVCSPPPHRPPPTPTPTPPSPLARLPHRPATNPAGPPRTSLLSIDTLRTASIHL